MVEHVPVPLLSLHKNGDVTLWNNSARRFFGHHVVKRLDDITALDNELATQLSGVLPGARPLFNVEIDSMPCIKELANRGEGITIFPPSWVGREIETGRLTRAHVDPAIRITAKLGRSQRQTPPRAVRIVTSELQQLAIDLAPETGWNVATGPETEVWEG